MSEPRPVCIGKFSCNADVHIPECPRAPVVRQPASEPASEQMRKALDGTRGPYRIAGSPPGIISADDYDVTDEALALLAALSAREEQTRPTPADNRGASSPPPREEAQP